MDSHRGSLAKTAAIAVLSLSLFFLPGANASGKERSFTLSTDPEQVVLRCRYGGSMRPSVVYTLYGDGRLVHERVKDAAEQVSDHLEMQLSSLEMHALLRTIIDSGFLECGGECSRKRCAELRGVHRIPPTADCGGVTLTINLDSYQGPADSEPRAVQRREYVECAQGLVTYYCTESELPEIQGLRDLGEALHEYKTAAQEAEQ